MCFILKWSNISFKNFPLVPVLSTAPVIRQDSNNNVVSSEISMIQLVNMVCSILQNHLHSTFQKHSPNKSYNFFKFLYSFLFSKQSFETCPIQITPPIYCIYYSPLRFSIENVKPNSLMRTLHENNMSQLTSRFFML